MVAAVAAEAVTCIPGLPPHLTVCPPAPNRPDDPDGDAKREAWQAWALDLARYRVQRKEAIKNNLADLVSEESIITSQGGRIVKVPVRGMDEPKFRYDQSGKQQVGQGSGGTKVGDTIGRAAPGPGQGRSEPHRCLPAQTGAAPACR